MTTTSIATIIAGIVAVTAAGYYYTRPELFNPEVAPVQPADRINRPDRTASNSFTTRKLTTSASEPETESHSEATADTVTLPDGSVIEVETVDGFTVRKDRNCTIKVHYITMGDGEVKMMHSCEPNTPRPVDNYTTYSDATLETLAYSDAHAALVLSKRLHQKDFSRAIKFGLRSAALSGDPKAIDWLLFSYQGTEVKHGQVQLKTIEDKYVLSGVVDALNNNNARHPYWNELAYEHQGDLTSIETLDARIASLVQEYESIRSEVGVE